MVLIFSLLSKAVLAVVVTHTPRIALGSQAGTGVTGVGVGVVTTDVVFLEQAVSDKPSMIVIPVVFNKVDNLDIWLDMLIVLSQAT
jgi:hypothetical protein